MHESWIYPELHQEISGSQESMARMTSIFIITASSIFALHLFRFGYQTYEFDMAECSHIDEEFIEVLKTQNLKSIMPVSIR